MKFPSRQVKAADCQLNWEALAGALLTGVGSPNGSQVASPPALYLRQDGGAGTTLYVKESGVNTDTGWVGK
jgi:hypothetical protein